MPETPPLYSARPSVRLEGNDNPELTEGLIMVLVEESTDGLFRCEASFGNWGTSQGTVGFLYSERGLLDFGKRLAIRMGAGDKAGDVFGGRITGIEQHFPADRPPEVTVLAEDRFQDLRMTRRTRVFEDTTASDVIQQVASDHGLQADANIDGPTFKVLTQVNQSDLAFVRDVARSVDAEVWIEGSSFKAASRARRTGGPSTLTYGKELRELEVLADLAGQRTAVSVGGWDVSSKEAVDEEATESAISAELDGGRSGPSLLQDVFGERKDRLVHTVPFTAAEGRAMAETAMRRMARSFVSGHGICEGDARIRVGGTVDLQGVPGWAGGRYRVAHVRHQFDSVRGYLTTFWIERPGLIET